MLCAIECVCVHAHVYCESLKCVSVLVCASVNVRWDDKWCVHARVMIVYSKIHRKLNAQVKGAAKKMVTVVATRELGPGDMLRRFKAETDQDEPRRGNDNNRCMVLYILGGVIAVRLVAIGA